MSLDGAGRPSGRARAGVVACAGSLSSVGVCGGARAVARRVQQRRRHPDLLERRPLDMTLDRRQKKSVLSPRISRLANGSTHSPVLTRVIVGSKAKGWLILIDDIDRENWHIDYTTLCTAGYKEAPRTIPVQSPAVQSNLHEI